MGSTFHVDRLVHEIIKRKDEPDELVVSQACELVRDYSSSRMMPQSVVALNEAESREPRLKRVPFDCRGCLQKQLTIR
jgi:hypothetical protein